MANIYFRKDTKLKKVPSQKLMQLVPALTTFQYII